MPRRVRRENFTGTSSVPGPVSSVLCFVLTGLTSSRLPAASCRRRGPGCLAGLAFGGGVRCGGACDAAISTAAIAVGVVRFWLCCRRRPRPASLRPCRPLGRRWRPSSQPARRSPRPQPDPQQPQRPQHHRHPHQPRHQRLRLRRAGAVADSHHLRRPGVGGGFPPPPPPPLLRRGPSSGRHPWVWSGPGRGGSSRSWPLARRPWCCRGRSRGTR